MELGLPPNPELVTSARISIQKPSLAATLEPRLGLTLGTGRNLVHGKGKSYRASYYRRRLVLQTSPSNFAHNKVMVHRESVQGLFWNPSVISELNNMKLDPGSSNKPISKLQYPQKLALPLDLRPLRIHLSCEQKRCFYVGTNTKHQNIFIQYNFLNSSYPISQFCQMLEPEIKLSSWPSFQFTLLCNKSILRFHYQPVSQMGLGFHYLNTQSKYTKKCSRNKLLLFSLYIIIESLCHFWCRCEQNVHIAQDVHIVRELIKQLQIYYKQQFLILR